MTTSYSYDGFLPTGETFSGPVNGAVQRTFNTDFKVASVSVNGANPVAYAHDNDGLLTQAGALALTRDAQNGLLTGTSLGSVTDSRSYNAYGEETGFHATYPTGLDYAVNYDRDGVGRIVTKTETVNGTVTAWTYGYDVAGRLSDVLKDGAVYAHYDYDANGNRISATGSSPVIARLAPPAEANSLSATYDNQDRMLTYGSNTYAYTANGELTAKTDTATGKVTTYQYDVLGNLKHVNLPDGTAIDYVIDGRNRRIGKKVNGALTQAWLYDGQLRPVAEMDGAGNLVSRFIYATHINVPDYMLKGGVTYRIITDHLGSPRFIVDSSTGMIAQRMDYDDFGNVLLDTNPGFTPFGFAGGLYDNQTKLVRFGARDYDAETGRWTSKDPIGFAGGNTNLFGYVLNDSINGMDPNGREVTLLVGIAAVVVLGVVIAAIGVNIFIIKDTVENQRKMQECVPCHGLKPPNGKGPPMMRCHKYHLKTPTESSYPYQELSDPALGEPPHVHTEPEMPGPSTGPAFP